MYETLSPVATKLRHYEVNSDDDDDGDGDDDEGYGRKRILYLTF